MPNKYGNSIMLIIILFLNRFHPRANISRIIVRLHEQDIRPVSYKKYSIMCHGSYHSWVNNVFEK